MNFLYRLKQLILIFGDIFMYGVGFYIALALRNLEVPSWENVERHLVLFLAVFGFWIIVNYINGLYDLVRLSSDRIFYRRFLETTGIALIIGIIFFYILPERAIAPKTILLLTVVFGYGLSLLWRLLFQILLGAKKLMTNVIFIGYTSETQDLANMLVSNPKRGYHIAACIDPSGEFQNKKIEGVAIYKSLKAIRPAITTHKINLVVIAPHLQENEDAVRELYELLFWPVELTDLTSFYEHITGRIPPSTFSESWFLDHVRNNTHPVYENIRVLIDYSSAVVLSIIFCLFFPFIAIAIRTNSKGPIFFKQKRVGKYGKVFHIIKFRSMFALSKDGSAETEGAQFAKKNDKRITIVGKILRKTRIDELPQCLNLLKGDISLIGPRPERPEIVNQLQEKMPYYPLRHVIKPGLTGWAVLHQNYTDTLETSLQKLQYDLYYIKNRSFLLDISILLRTMNIVVRLKGQ
ncbi:MAG: sugar transferase [Candidatus Magasanikbacteria bacterium]